MVHVSENLMPWIVEDWADNGQAKQETISQLWDFCEAFDLCEQLFPCEVPSLVILVHYLQTYVIHHIQEVIKKLMEKYLMKKNHA